jgi:NADPH:quinone reductase-like Zn-dependent oxidoreductase
MKAIRTHEPTGISGLVYEEAPDPTPMVGDVLVKVAACGITHNELDWPQRDPGAVVPTGMVEAAASSIASGNPSSRRTRSDR